MKNANNITFFKKSATNSSLPAGKTIRARNISKLLKDRRKSSRDYFEALQQELLTLIEKISTLKEIDFEQITLLMDRSLLLMELDIYLPSSAPTEKDHLLEKTRQILLNYFETHNNNAKAIVIALDMLSRNNYEASFDYCWMHLEKISLFQEIIEKLSNQFSELLKKDMDIANQMIDMEMIAITISAVSVWRRFNYPIEDMIKAMEVRFQSDIKLSPEVSLECLLGITRLIRLHMPSNDPLKLQRNIIRSKMFEMLNQQALPLLIADAPPLKADSIERRIFDSIEWLLDMLRHTPSHIKDTPSYCPVFKSLRTKMEQLAQCISQIELQRYKDRKMFVSYKKEGNKTFFDLEHDIKYTKIILAYDNPRGLQWFIKRKKLLA